MSRLSALLVDDEPLARRELRNLLAAHDEITVIGEARDLATARAMIAAHPPDIVFLDVQLIGETGFDLLEDVPPTVRVVFVTAYDTFAVRAFEVNALDYLLKPVRRQRLAATIERLLDQEVSVSTVEAAQGGLEPGDHLFLPVRGGHRFVRITDIPCILAESNYSRVCLPDGESALLRQPLRAWARRLPQSLFLRIHRSTIVNLEHVKHVEDAGDGTFTVRVTGRREALRMSRRHAARLRARQSFGG